MLFTEEVHGQTWVSPPLVNGLRAVIERNGSGFQPFLAFRGVLSPLDGAQTYKTADEAREAAKGALRLTAETILAALGEPCPSEDRHA